MEMPISVIPDGNVANPQFAFKRGPQILSTDQNVSDDGGLPTGGWFGDEQFEVKANVDGETKDIHLVPFAEAGQTMADYNILFRHVSLIGEDKIQDLSR